MTLAYERGFAAGKRGKGANDCPYEGRNEGSLELMIQWLTGNFHGLTAPSRAHRPKAKPTVVTRRRSLGVGKNWPRSAYVRARILAIKFGEVPPAARGLTACGEKPATGTGGRRNNHENAITN